MKRVQKIIALLFVTVAAIGSMPVGMRAQSRNQAALVIRHGDSDVRTACVDFDEPQISGYDLLQRSGAQLQLDVQGMGALVCSIDETGCPPNDCLCQCKGGGDCIYWSYWHRANNTWHYSQGGASMVMVEPGSIEGWSWGPGAVNQAVPPPDLTFEDVCQPAEPDTPTPSPTATQTQPPLVITPGAADTRESAPTATAVVSSRTATATPTVPPTATPSSSLTPTPLRRASTATAAPTQTSSPPVATVAEGVSTTAPPTAAGAESGTEEVDEAGEPPPVTAAAEEQLAEADAPLTAPAPLAVASQGSSQTAISTPLPNTQKKAAPTTEPTPHLQVIGSGVVPTIEMEGDAAGVKNQDTSSVLNPANTPYLVFLLIIAGLVTLSAIITLRRRSRS